MLRDEKFYLSKEGLRKTAEEYNNLKQLRAQQAKKAAPSALSSEELNTEFVSFREDLDYMDTKLEELDHILKHAELIKPPVKTDCDKVALGAKVVLEVSGSIDEFILVGTLEANPSRGKISNESPLGRALLGHRAGDEISVSPTKETVYKIKKIEY